MIQFAKVSVCFEKRITAMKQKRNEKESSLFVTARQRLLNDLEQGCQIFLGT
jgi:hypothetical protein